MKRSLLVALGVIIALQPVQLSAQIFNGTPNDVEFLKFLGGSGVNATYGPQVGPYKGHFEEPGTLSHTVHTNPSLPFALYCVDYLHYASRSTGLVNVSALSSGADLTKTRLNDFVQYQKSAYLSSLFDSWTDYQSDLETEFDTRFSKAEVWGGLHAAIWYNSTGPSDPLGRDDTALARNYFLGLADTKGGSFSTEGWYVLSEADVPLDSEYSGQEFVIRTWVEVPEPSSVLLMVTGLFLLVGANRKRLIGLVDDA